MHLVAKAWDSITFKFHDLVERIGLRYNNGLYLRCTEESTKTFQCGQQIFTIKTLQTLHHGKCYTLEFNSSAVNCLETDNILIYFKRDLNLFIHSPGLWFQFCPSALFLMRTLPRPRFSSPALFLAHPLSYMRSSSPALLLARALPRPRVVLACASNS